MRFVSYGDRRKVAAALKADLHRPEPGGRLAGSDRLLRVRHGGQVPPDGDDLGAGLGEVHSLPGLPADAQACHLSPTSWEVPPPPTVSRLRATSCARSPRTAVTSPPMRRWSSCCGWRSATPVDKRARERDKEKGLPASKRRAKGRLVEGQITTDWNKALAQLTTAYPDRFAPHL